MCGSKTQRVCTWSIGFWSCYAEHHRSCPHCSTIRPTHHRRILPPSAANVRTKTPTNDGRVLRQLQGGHRDLGERGGNEGNSWWGGCGKVDGQMRTAGWTRPKHLSTAMVVFWAFLGWISAFFRFWDTGRPNKKVDRSVFFRVQPAGGGSGFGFFEVSLKRRKHEFGSRRTDV